MSGRNLTTQDILKKEFKPAIKGFNTAEVDEFLDLIIRDYESYEKEINYLKNEVSRLKRSAEQQQKPSSNNHPSRTTNYDILKRLSRLEKVVYGENHPQDFND